MVAVIDVPERQLRTGQLARRQAADRGQLVRSKEGEEMTIDEDRCWDSPHWHEPSDDRWRRRLRRHQGWWRATHTDLGPGPVKGGTRPVVSMLPHGVGLTPNLLTDQAVEAAEESLTRLEGKSGRGLIDRDRLERNLLSSQPLAFNLFGHLRATPDALLPWVRTIDAAASVVTAVKLEIAPTRTPIGGSAFDAFVTYVRTDGSQGFLGIECKYAETLAAAQREPAGEKYRAATERSAWKGGGFRCVGRARPSPVLVQHATHAVGRAGR